jgi:hypothetical protein
MSELDPLPLSAPKQWIKQEAKRIQKEIATATNSLKQHQILRKKVGLMQADYFKDTKPVSFVPEKREKPESWGVKLAYSVEVPKKRGRPRKSDIDTSQTRIVLFKSQSKSDR